MNFEPTPIPDLWIIHLPLFEDERGDFKRIWCRKSFAENRVQMEVAQCNASLTRLAGTIRGLHYQLPPAAEKKLVCCTAGGIFDVVVDLRKESPTYLQHFSCKLRAGSGKAILVSEGMAHGCQALEDNTELLYQVSAPFNPERERGLRYDDPALKISWPLTPTAVSKKDSSWPLL